MQRLKASELASLPDGMYNDGNGLYLRVRNQGRSRDFLYRGTINGKQTFRSLGSTKTLTLSEARQKAKTYVLEPVVKSPYFKDEWEKALREVQFFKQWKYEYQFKCYKHYIETHVLPILGSMEIEDITVKDILRVLQPLWKTNPYQGSRTRYILQHLFNRFMVQSYCKKNPAIWEGNLSLYLPVAKKLHKVEHRASAPYQEIPSLVQRFMSSTLGASLFAVFLLATCLRVTEGRLVKWSYIKHSDTLGDYLDIPAENRKGHKTENNLVPLTPEVLHLLTLVPKKGEYIFSSTKGNALEINRVNKFYRESMKLPYSPHGGRTSFRVWSAENGEDFTASELILSHSIGNETTQAYFRTSLYEKRRDILIRWNRYIFSLVFFGEPSLIE